MPTSVVLNPHFDSFVRAQVESGRYSDASEVVRAGLRLLEDSDRVEDLRLQVLRQEIAAGSASGIPREAHEVFDELELKYAQKANGK